MAGVSRVNGYVHSTEGDMKNDHSPDALEGPEKLLGTSHVKFERTIS